MSDRTTVHVSNIDPSTSEKEVQDFFSFWYAASSIWKIICLNEPNSGKIVSISVTPTSGEPGSLKSATVTFEKDA